MRIRTIPPKDAKGAPAAPPVKAAAVASPAKAAAVASPAKAAAAASSAKPAPGKTVAQRAQTALRRSRLKAARPWKLRLIDAVALSAAALLLLKILSLSQAGVSDPSLPAFARAIAKARTGYTFPDPETTGSVGTKQKAEGKDNDKSEAKAEPPANPQQALAGAADQGSPSEKSLLDKLGARRDALRQRGEELDLREKMLDEAEKKIETGIGDLKKAEDKVDAAAKAKDEAEKQGLKSIVTMYETMKPKDAARVFDRLGHDVLVPLVVAMNPRKMAEILAVMQPEAAERLTVALANRARGNQAQAQNGGPVLPPGELPAIDPAAAR